LLIIRLKAVFTQERGCKFKKIIETNKELS
jgi:hypothetical protein